MKVILPHHIVIDHKAVKIHSIEIGSRFACFFSSPLFPYLLMLFTPSFCMSVCRALGIPCRSVTNFGSAHDCDSSITIDVHWTFKGDPLEELNTDSIWYGR